VGQQQEEQETRCSSVDSLFFFGHGSSCIRVGGRQRRPNDSDSSGQVAGDMQSTDASNQPVSQPTLTLCRSQKVSTRLNKRGPPAISVLLARPPHPHPVAATDNGVVDGGADFVEFRRPTPASYWHQSIDEPIDSHRENGERSSAPLTGLAAHTQLVSLPADWPIHRRLRCGRMIFLCTNH